MGVLFGDQSGLPIWFRRLLRAWLKKFHVTPRGNLEQALWHMAGTQVALLHTSSSIAAIHSLGGLSYLSADSHEIRQINPMTEPAELVVRDAVEADLARIIELLSDDFLGSTREAAADNRGIAEAYQTAFQAVEASPDNRLFVACHAGDVFGTFQLTMIPGLSFTGGKRAQIEAVRIDESLRGLGAGKRMIEFGIAEAREAGCCMVQLTMNKQREETLRFYERLGFVATHEGFKLML